MRAHHHLVLVAALATSGCASPKRVDDQKPRRMTDAQIVADVEARWPSSSASERSNLVDRLCNIAAGSPAARRVLVEHWSEIGPYNEKWLLKNAFKNQPDVAILPALETSLTRDDGEIRAAAWQAFDAVVDAQPGRRFERAEALWPHCDQLGHDALAHYLLETEGPEASASLVRHFHEVSPVERAAIVADFGQYLYEPGFTIVGEALSDPDPRVRKAAEDAFDRIKHHKQAVAEFHSWQEGRSEPDPVAQLVPLLDSPNREVVIGAARSLGALKASGALPRLVHLLERDDPGVREAVHEAISRIEMP